MLEDQTLLKEEDKLVKNGDYEQPNIQSHLDEDDKFLEDTLRLQHLRKEFISYDTKAKETNKAVDGLSLSIFKNQIFVLLGHNGAGKTTVISMLTGFL